MWSNMFDLDLSIAEKMVRPIVVYVFLLIGLRVSGKRELAQLNAMDLIVLLTLSNTVQNAIIGPDNTVIGGLIGAATLLAMNYCVVRFLFSHPKFDRLVEGKPTLLVEHGMTKPGNMQRELITPQELKAAAHKQGFANLHDVSKAVLEPSGVISFVGKNPPAGEVWHADLTRRLEEISGQLTAVRAQLATRA